MALHPSVTQRKQRERSDGGIVDAEIVRPRSWILARGLCACRMLPLNLPAPYRVLGTDLGHLSDRSDQSDQSDRSDQSDQSGRRIGGSK